MGTARERILEGAAAAFGELGYAHTRVEDILRAAGISRPTFYKEFASGDDVFHTLATESFAALIETLGSALRDTADPGEKVLAVIRGFFAWRARLGPFGRVLVAEARNPSSPLHEPRRQVVETVVAAFRAQLAELGRTAADPLLFEALIAAAEHLGDTLPFASGVRPEDVERRERVLFRFAIGALVEEGEALPPLPADPDARPRKKRRRRTSDDS